MQELEREAAEARIAKNTAALVDELATQVSSYLTNVNVFVQAEHGILGVGPLADESESDWDLINAGRQLVTEVPGCCYLSSADAFGMVRGGHVDATVLGAFCVDEDALGFVSFFFAGREIRDSSALSWAPWSWPW